MPLGFYNYTVVLTYFGMLTAYTGIAFAWNGKLHNALLCLLIAGVCDMFDGPVARTKADRTREEKHFGIQIDSFSDLICFGVLPAVIIYMGSEGSSAAFYLGGFYLLCALIRLAWFNVDEAQRQDSTEDRRRVYYGLPVTSAALVIPVVLGLEQLWGLPLNLTGPAVLAGMGVLFLTPFPLRKPALPGKLGLLLWGGAELLVLLAGVEP